MPFNFFPNGEPTYFSPGNYEIGNTEKSVDGANFPSNFKLTICVFNHVNRISKRHLLRDVNFNIYILEEF